jgi:hypothetical protein
VSAGVMVPFVACPAKPVDLYGIVHHDNMDHVVDGLKYGLSVNRTGYTVSNDPFEEVARVIYKKWWSEQPMGKL